jgi:DNA-directed RNA polymerase sigma subunit (sigma70/sigma32)
MLDDDLFDDIDDFSPSAFAHPPEVDQRIEDAGVAACVELLLARLAPNDRMVVERTFGLDGSPAESVESVAARYGLSVDAIDWIQQSAIRRMRVYAAWVRLPVFEYLAEAGYPEHAPSALVSRRT